MKLTYAEKFVSQKTALELIHKIAKETGLNRQDRKSLEDYLLAIPTDEHNEIRLDSIHGLWANFKNALKHDDVAFLERRRGFKTDHVVDIIEFAESPEFANKKGTLWNTTKDNIWEIHHGTSNNGEPPCIIVLGGAAGTGKSMSAVLSCGYTRYLLGNMWNPHLEFEHDPGTWLTFAIQAPKKEEAEDSLYDKVQYLIDDSPWFQKNCLRRMDYNKELQWPRDRINIMPLTGVWRSGRGKDVFWFAVTEINDMPVIERSKQLQHSSKQALDVGHEIWSTLTDRIETRFSEMGGGFPGKAIADSQRAHAGDFTDGMIEQAKTNPSILVIERPVWEAQDHKYPRNPDGTFVEGCFLVELGDDQRPPRIVERKEDALNKIIEIPNRHRARFDADIENPLKTLAGVPTRATGRFIPFPERITKAQVAYVEEMGDLRLFRHETISFRELFGDLKAGDPVDWDLLINQAYIDHWLDKSIVFVVHTDLSETGDASGFGVSHIHDKKQVAHFNKYDHEENKIIEAENIMAPVFFGDGFLQIIARPGERIDINLIRDLALQLKKRGLNIQYGSADWTESAAMISAWNKAGITAQKVSVDRSPAAYWVLYHAIRDYRYIVQPHSVLDRESRRLIKKVRGGKTEIDHPPTESKDVSDCAAGNCLVLDNTVGQAIYQQIETKSEPEEDEDDFRPVRRIGGRGRRMGARR